MKKLTLIALSAIVAGSLSACTSTSADAPAANSSTAEPASTSAATPTPKPAPVPEPAKPAAPAVKMVTIPAGTEIEVALTEGLSSSKNEPGDLFMASLAAPVVIGGS